MKQQLDIGIIGNGVVGGALRRWLIRYSQHSVWIYDPPQGYGEELPYVDIAFISVPAPTKGMELDLSTITTVLDLLRNERGAPGLKADLVCLRSTVLPGTCDAMTEKYGQPIISMPEFLTERCRDEDLAAHDVIAGIPDAYDNPHDRDYLHRMLFQAFGGKKKIHVSKARNTEMAKYVHNVFGALKVTYFNGIARQCMNRSIDYEEVRKLVQVSGLINSPHTQVPGPDGQRGYGGNCFPKDVAAFMGFLGNDCEHLLIRDVLCLNRFYRGEKKIPNELEPKQQPKFGPDIGSDGEIWQTKSDLQEECPFEDDSGYF